MGLFQRLFAKKRPENEKTAENISVSQELLRLRELDAFMRALLNADHFVAKSEYQSKLSEYADLSAWFQVLKTSGTLEDYCKKQGVSSSEIATILNRYQSFETLVDSQNDRFIKSKMILEKAYLDTILKDCDPKILLDDDQRKVVLTDEDYCLVVAGAGAGKTTTVAAKVKYLVDKQGVDPKKILVISFTNKAVNELKQRIIGELNIECPIATFHSTGNAVIHKQNPDKLNIVDSNKL